MLDWKDKVPWDLVSDAATEYGLDPNLIGAIIGNESGGNCYAIRYEPQYRFRKEPYKFARYNGITEATEDILQQCSFGLMQVMGEKAREMGHTRNLLELTEPETGIEYGCKFLYHLSQRMNKLEEVISSYNAGSIKVDKKGEFLNKDYVKDILARIEELKKSKTK